MTTELPDTHSSSPAPEPLALKSNEELGAWIRCAEDLPAYDLPVWLYEDGRAYVGCRVFESDGWLWAKCYSMPHLDAAGAWKTEDAEIDDDYSPTLWQPLPEAPRYTQAALDAAAASARELAASLRVE